MLDVPNLLALSQQIGMLPTQLPRVFSSECSFSFMLPWWWSLHPAVCQSYCASLLPHHSFPPSCLVFFSATFCVVPTSSSIVFIFVSCFSGSPTSASSYCGSGESRSQSGESAPVEVCVSWWKPSSQSPLDQGKSFPPSVEEALWHSVTLTK